MTSHPNQSAADEIDRIIAMGVLIGLARTKSNQEMADVLGISRRRAKVLRHRYQQENPPLPYAQTVELLRNQGLL